jgi:hypothetical protein
MIALIASRYQICLRHDDPAFVIVELNRMALEQQIDALRLLRIDFESGLEAHLQRVKSSHLSLSRSLDQLSERASALHEAWRAVPGLEQNEPAGRAVARDSATFGAWHPIRLVGVACMTNVVTSLIWYLTVTRLLR